MPGIFSCSAEQKALPVAAGVSLPPPARKRLEFAYDYLGRRIAKKVFVEESGTGLQPVVWKLVKDLRFVYDGWKMIAELDHSFATGPGLTGSRVNRTFLWGEDVSGTMTGAGGVGGLISTTYQGTTYHVCSDANGNVTGLVPTSGPQAGQLIARYDYDPFGNRITNTGPDVELCPFGFSSKYTDSETGLVYYGYRYYSPELGRWLSRDPIGERGGINLYGMVGNDAVNSVDRLGKYAVSIGGGWYIFINNPTFNLDNLKGSRVTNADSRYTCECATGAQYLTGTAKHDGIHDAPSTSEWRKGPAVSAQTARGTMIAKGWVGDRYMSLSQTEAAAQGVDVNHVGLFGEIKTTKKRTGGFLGMGIFGGTVTITQTVVLLDQWDPGDQNGATMDETTDGALDWRTQSDVSEWFVVKAKSPCDKNKSGSSIHPPP